MEEEDDEEIVVFFDDHIEAYVTLVLSFLLALKKTTQAPLVFSGLLLL